MQSVEWAMGADSVGILTVFVHNVCGIRGTRNTQEANASRKRSANAVESAAGATKAKERRKRWWSVSRAAVVGSFLPANRKPEKGRRLVWVLSRFQEVTFSPSMAASFLCWEMPRLRPSTVFSVWGLQRLSCLAEPLAGCPRTAWLRL